MVLFFWFLFGVVVFGFRVPLTHVHFEALSSALVL